MQGKRNLPRLCALDGCEVIFTPLKDRQQCCSIAHSNQLRAPAQRIRREPISDGSVLRIPLSQGMEALIDTSDWPLVSNYSWQAAKDGPRWYAIATIRVAGGKQTTLRLHRAVMGLGTERFPRVDHRDGNGLNNVRSNLRIAEAGQNSRNATGWRSRSGPYKGAYRSQWGDRWIGLITKEYETRYLGTFDTAEEAARAYDVAARELFGEFARYNFPQ